MPFHIAFDADRRLLVVTLDGDGSVDEELDVLRAAASRGPDGASLRVLVDRLTAGLGLSPADVPRLVEEIEARGDALRGMRVAQVVGSDLDFGMLRMLELKSQARVAVGFGFGVFRSVPEACGWLGVPEAAVAALRASAA